MKKLKNSVPNCPWSKIYRNDSVWSSLRARVDLAVQGKQGCHPRNGCKKWDYVIIWRIGQGIFSGIFKFWWNFGIFHILYSISKAPSLELLNFLIDAEMLWVLKVQGDPKVTKLQKFNKMVSLCLPKSLYYNKCWNCPPLISKHGVHSS